jgi:hypothetical protein
MIALYKRYLSAYAYVLANIIVKTKQRQNWYMCINLLIFTDNVHFVFEEVYIVFYLVPCVHILLSEYRSVNQSISQDYLASVAVCELKSSQTDLPLKRSSNTHTNGWYTHTATYHVNIQQTQISGRHYRNSTNHVIWPPEDGRIERTETCRGLVAFTNMF